MFKKLLLLVVLMLFASVSYSQITENFESTDSIPPPGWTVVNNAAFPIDPATNWVVRDTGLNVPGLADALSVAHTGEKSIGVSWWSSIDTVGGATTISDAWLITPQFLPSTDWSVNFWATGGTPNFSDSVSVWASFIDSLPPNFSEYVGSIFWPTGSTYGVFTEHNYSLSTLAGLGVPIWIGFRYNMDCAIDGFFVYLDDVYIGPPVSISQIGNNIPDKFALEQNYPNPFNPSTTIKFDLAKNTNVSLVIFNSLGQQVETIFKGTDTPAGSYEATFDASKLSSGTYFYRLITNDYTETKKMLLVK